MVKIANIGSTRDVAITVLVDNRADLIVESTDTVKYFTDAPLLAEHGFAALVDLKAAGVRILWDAGITPMTLLENMKRMQVAPSTISKIALSHGHDDHTAGVADVIRAMDLHARPRKWERDARLEDIRRYAEGRQAPVVVHPAAFRERWDTSKDGAKYGPILPPSRREWEAAGAEIILSEGPYELGPGCWASGAIPRLSFEKAGASEESAYRDGDVFMHDTIDEDQAIILHVQDKGLVILSGCAHSGIVNTVNYAREISGVGQVWAILGGFHLARAKDEEIQRTVDAIEAVHPQWIVPSHCTGFRAMCQFAAQMPHEFLPGIVGATYLF